MISHNKRVELLEKGRPMVPSVSSARYARAGEGTGTKTYRATIKAVSFSHEPCPNVKA
jgi:hypothetical protein